MGKAKGAKKNAAAASPYEGGKSKNTIFKFNKDLGQRNILKNPGVADAIVAKSYLKPTDVVLEVGPGSGNLTVRILAAAKKVIAVELDPRMAAEVTKRVQGTPEQKKLEVLLGDVIKMDNLPPFDCLISNTPYQISSPLIFKILSMKNPPRTCVLMLQREFAMRLVARPGDPLYCRLSVNAQFFAKISHILKVSKANFRPPPKVESSVVRIEPKTGAERPAVNYNEWDGLTRVIFSRRNRTIRASFLGTKDVPAMLERNYRTWASLNNVPIEEGNVEDPDATPPADLDTMDVDPDLDTEWTGLGEDAAFGAGVEMDDDGAPDFFGSLAQPAEKTKARRPRTKVGQLVYDKIVRVLEQTTELADQRASKCDENDFLRLLHAFNAEGIHFA